VGARGIFVRGAWNLSPRPHTEARVTAKSYYFGGQIVYTYAAY
jgi:hypothetical protein